MSFLRPSAPWLHFEPLQLLSFDFDTDPDPAFDCDADPNPAIHSDADPDPAFHSFANPDPASQNDPDLCYPDPDPQHC